MQQDSEHTDAHIPVLLKESIQMLNIKPSGCYLDATFGRGGHSREILKQLDPDGQLWVLDRDPEALACANDLASMDKRVRVCNGTFSQISELTSRLDRIDGALFDLGISSPQIDQAERGFSFQSDGPLDMRMNNQQGQSAAEWLARANVDEIAWVIQNYGEELYADKIAQQIVHSRQRLPITKTKQLVEIILSVVPSISKGKHPATKVFQALRMHVNDELDEIRRGIPQALEKMHAGSRLAIISYHSLEHQLISDIIKKRRTNHDCLDLTSNLPQLRKIGHAMKPGRDETLVNRRARSALLRTWEVKK